MALFRTDFREYATAAAPSDWSQPWHAFGVATIVADGGSISGKVLDLSGSNSVRKAITWDKLAAVLNRENVDVLWYYQRISGSMDDSHALVRGSGDSATETGYCIGHFSNTNGDRVVEYNSAASDIMAASNPSAIAAGTKIWARARANGTALKFKRWTGAVGDEPGTWGFEVTDSTLTAAGLIGFFQFGNSKNYIEVFAVGTNGDIATVNVAPETAPTIGTITPNDTGASIAFSGLDLYASDVEYRIDGGSWVSAGTTSSPLVVTGQSSAVGYDIELRAANAGGGGPASSVAEYTTTGEGGEAAVIAATLTASGSLVAAVSVSHALTADFSASGTLTASLAVGAVLRLRVVLHDASAAPLGVLTGVRVVVWTGSLPTGGPALEEPAAAIDSSGALEVSLASIGGLAADDPIFALVYRPDALEPRDSLVFAGPLTAQLL